MAEIADLQKSHTTLKCAECGGSFKYPATRSNNYSKFCEACRKLRTAANKRRFDERRSSSGPGPAARDVHAMLESIPDYIVHPVRIIDAAIRDL